MGPILPSSTRIAATPDTPGEHQGKTGSITTGITDTGRRETGKMETRVPQSYREGAATTRKAPYFS